MRLNLYTCQDCGGCIVTRDLVKGVTPFMIGCRVHLHDAAILANEDYMSISQLRRAARTLKCQGMMYSSFYTMPEKFPLPTWEWYKPNAEEYALLSKITREDHVDKGGLLLRRIKEAA